MNYEGKTNAELLDIIGQREEQLRESLKQEATLRTLCRELRERKEPKESEAWVRFACAALMGYLSGMTDPEKYQKNTPAIASSFAATCAYHMMDQYDEMIESFNLDPQENK